MGQVEMVMPKMGESVMEGTILKWLKQVGDEIELDESVLEVATDKVDTDVPAPFSGVLQKILANEGDIVAVDKPIAIIETTQVANEIVKESSIVVPAMKEVQALQETTTIAKNFPNENLLSDNPNNGFYSPLVMNIAKKEKISATELEKIIGTGKEKRVTKRDILTYIKNRASSIVPQTEKKNSFVENTQTARSSAFQTETFQSQSLNGHEEIIEMDRMRKLIADRMVESKRISPHVTSFVEADVTNLYKWREKQKNAFKQKEGTTLTFTPIFIQAVVKAIKEFPLINVSVNNASIHVKKDINIGMAVALPSGNLIVPVIHKADHYNLTGLALKVNDLAARARLNQLKPDELSGGTYTISNVGTFGNVMGTPIIVQPQVAIMAIGAIRKKPAVIETDQGDFIGIRHMMFLSHSYDHRVVDGSLGGMFVKKVADFLENFDTEQKI
ncbi:MAG: dihydrolipoamide acetyltransferase family protein [Bacteroidota bacterium]